MGVMGWAFPGPPRSSLTVRNWTDNMDTDNNADSSVASEASDDGPVDETLIERISALRDIIRARDCYGVAKRYG